MKIVVTQPVRERDPKDLNFENAIVCFIICTVKHYTEFQENPARKIFHYFLPFLTF